MFKREIIVAIFASLSLAGCAVSAAPSGAFINSGPGYFGGTHIRYESTIKPGHIYRTFEKGPLEFGSRIKPICTKDFDFIKVSTGPDENKQDYEDKLSGKASASASGIKWIKALFDLSAGGEISLDGKWENVRSNDALNVDQIRKEIGAGCKRLISRRRGHGYTVFFVQRVYRADTVTFKGIAKANASLKVGELKFVSLGPKIEGEGSRELSKVFHDTVVEVVPYQSE